jgi:hypothetical protein
LACFAALAAVELAYLTTQFAFAIAITRPPYEGLRLRYIAVLFAAARSATRVELVARLFPITEPATKDDRSAAAWRIWHRAHLPAYAVRALRWWPGRQRAIIESIFLGLTIAVRRATEKPGIQSSDRSRISFDEFWPVVECVEEMAVCTATANHEVFASALTRLAATANDETVQAQLGWVVNELLERTASEQKLGLYIGLALLKSEAAGSREAIKTLIAYKDEKGGEPDPNMEKLAAAAKAVSVLAAPNDRAFAEACTGRRRQMLEDSARHATIRVNKIVSALRDGDSDNDRTRASAADIANACDPLLAGATAHSGVDGIIGLASLRLVLRRLCKELPTETSESAMDVKPTGAAGAAPISLAEDVCAAIMRRFQDGVPGFVIIESIESVRDHRPGDAARAMAAFLGSVSGQLDPGIAVCICEGVEDQLNTLDEDAGAVSRQARFAWRRGDQTPWRAAWHAPATVRGLGQIQVFWQTTAPWFGKKRLHDVPQWMNLRLGLRT